MIGWLINMIKFVYFDVGGVAILDFSGTEKWKLMLSEIGINEKDFDTFDKYWAGLNGRVDLDLDVDSLKPEIEKRFGIEFPKNYSLLVNGFVEKFEKNETIWTVIHELKSKCGIGLLTNMYPRMLGEIVNKHLLPHVDWDIIVDSSVEKVRKPSKEIFELAEARCGFAGNEILFIDNLQRNIDGAKTVGWQTFLYDPKNLEASNKQLSDYLKEKVSL